MNDEVARKIEALERKLETLQRKVARRRASARGAGAVALAVAVGTPVLAWTYTRPHPAFEPGTPISSAQINDTFDDVYEALNTLDAENARVEADTAIDSTGALPVAGEFDSDGGAVVLWVSGSAWRSDVAGIAGVDVLVDGVSVGSVRTYTNEVSSHKALVATPFVLPRLSAGVHAVELQPLSGTSSDFNDFFRVVALELPR